MKKFICLSLAFLMLALCFAGCNSVSENTPSTTTEVATQDPRTDIYNEAFSLIQQGNLEAAYELFLELGDFMDSKKQLENFIYMPLKQVSTQQSSVHTEPYNSSVEFTLDDKGFPIKIHTEYSDGRETIYEFEYNDNGDFLKEATIRTNYNQTREYEYDEKGRLVKQIFKSSLMFEGKNTESSSVTEYLYDPSGNLTNKIITLSDGSKTSYEHSYTESGKIANTVYINEECQRKTTDEYIYDASDRLIQRNEHRTPADFGGDTVAEITTKYTYNDKGLKSKAELYYDNNAYVIYEYFYNTDGTISKEERTVYGGQDETLEYFYDEHGNVIKYTFSYGIGISKLSPFTVEEYKHDDKGNITKKITTQGDNHSETILYTYDEHGNVIKRKRIRLTSVTVHETTETEYKLVYLPCGLTEDISEYFNLLTT